MLRLAPSLLLSRRHCASLVALLLAAQLSLFAHGVGHDYFQDADQSHVVCGLCIAAQHLDHGLSAAAFELPQTDLHLHASVAPIIGARAHVHAAFEARAPPFTLPPC